MGNLALDFTDPETGEPFHTVVLAGENGCGKTIIFNEIYTTLGEVVYQKSFSFEIEIKLDEKNVSVIKSIFGDDNLDVDKNSFFVRHKKSDRTEWQNIEISFKDKNGVICSKISNNFYGEGGKEALFHIFLMKQQSLLR